MSQSDITFFNPIANTDYHDTPFKLNNKSDWVPVSSIVNILIRIVGPFNMPNKYNTRNILGLHHYTHIINSRINDIQYHEGYGNGNYNDLLHGKSIRQYFVSRNKYIGGYKSVYHIDNDNVISPLYILVTHKKYAKYIRQCVLLKETVRPEIFKLLVNDEFDIPKSKYRLIRPKYRKFIKKPLIEAGIEIETVSNFDDIFVRLELPKALGISGYKDKLTSISKEFLKSRKEINSEEDSEFEINY